MRDAMELLTLDDVAKALGLSRKTVANKVARGDIPAVKPTGRWRVQAAVLQAMREGLERDQLQHLHELMRSHRDDPQLGALVADYVRRQVQQ